ncbi:MAG: VWA domain-containing protein [Spirochaetaceae bacterium]|jgi:TolB-like protein|nr:VWA domain-containing protein [Spirochaetaceae bacterium]
MTTISLIQKSLFGVYFFAAVFGVFSQQARFIDTVIDVAAYDTGKSLEPKAVAVLLPVDTDEEKDVAKLVTEKLLAKLRRNGWNIVQAGDAIPPDVQNRWLADKGKQYSAGYTIFGSVHRLDAARYWLWLRIVDAKTAGDCWSEHYVFVLTALPPAMPEEENLVLLECAITQTTDPQGDVHLRIDYTAYPSLVNIEKIDQKKKTLTDLPKNADKPKNICFVIDISGSMGGVIGNTSKIYLVREAFSYLMDDWVQYDDYVSLALFDHRPPDYIPRGIFAPARSLRTGADREALNTAVRNLYPSGGTVISPGLEKGYELVRRNFHKDRINTVVLLTDGQTFGPDRELCKQYAAENRKQGIVTATFAIGDDADKALMTELAQLGGGLSLSLTEYETPEDLSNRLVWLTAGKPEEIFDSFIYNLEVSVTAETGVILKNISPKPANTGKITETVRGKKYNTIELTAVLPKTALPNFPIAKIKIEHKDSKTIREYQAVLGGELVENP